MNVRRRAVALVMVCSVVGGTFALADSPVVVDCGDGAPLVATVDADTPARFSQRSERCSLTRRA